MQFWLIQTPVCRSEGIQRASECWGLLISFMQSFACQGGDGRTREESESLAASRQWTFRIQWFFSQGFADSWDRLSFKTLGVNIEHLFQRAKYRPNSEKFAALSGGQCLELDRQRLAPKL